MLRWFAMRRLARRLRYATVEELEIMGGTRTTPAKPESALVELARLSRQLSRETDQRKCDELEARIAVLEQQQGGNVSA